MPYASVTFDASALPDNRYYDLDVTELVQGYVNGTYNNTGFFLKAKDENDNYIAFYSSDWSNASPYFHRLFTPISGKGATSNTSRKKGCSCALYEDFIE